MLTFSNHDRTIVRDVAKRVREIAAMPIMEERKALWKKHNSLQKCRPMILFFPEGSWSELIPAPACLCQDKDARRIEHVLRQRIYTFEHFQDDTVCVADWVEGAVIKSTGWGLWGSWKESDQHKGARAIVPALNTFDDFKKMHLPELTCDEAATSANVAAMQNLFGDILNVKLKGVSHISYHLMSAYIQLRGLDQMMLDMIDNPQFIHQVMAFFTEGHRKSLKQMREFNLLSLNNDNTYHSSGGNGWTDELPAPGFDPARVRPIDMWSSAEAQELALVSPEHHREFVMKYEGELLSPFGLNGYGCCEDLTQKLDDVFALIPRIRRISISPFANVDLCAVKMRDRAIFSWKPHPAHLVGQFNAATIRDYIQHTIDVCRHHDCVLEMILKDTHTCENHPERFDQWSHIARELIGQ